MSERLRRVLELLTGSPYFKNPMPPGARRPDPPTAPPPKGPTYPARRAIDVVPGTRIRASFVAAHSGAEITVRSCRDEAELATVTLRLFNHPLPLDELARVREAIRGLGPFQVLELTLPIDQQR